MRDSFFKNSFFIDLSWHELIIRNDIDGFNNFLHEHRYANKEVFDNMLDDNGNNILMHAAQHGNIAIIKILFASNFQFDYQRVNNAGHNIFDIIEEAKNNTAQSYENIKTLLLMQLNSRAATSKVKVNNSCC